MVFNPSYPAAGSWFMPTGTTSRDPRGLVPGDPGYGTPAAGQPSGGTRPRFYTTQAGPVVLPSDWSEDEAQQWVQAYDQQIATATQAWQQTAGLQRRQIEAQIEDLRKGRENAMAIAQLQAETSRYGVDANREVQLAQLKENQRQYDLRHGIDVGRLQLDRDRLGLDRDRLGLDHARTATEYLATPDRTFRVNQYMNLAGRVLANQSGVAPYQGAPTPKTETEYAALAGYTFPGGQSQPRSGYPDAGPVRGDVVMQRMGQTVPSPQTMQQQATSGAGTGAGSDARLKALRAVFEASPPSAGNGYDENDFAALSAARAIYGMNLNPKQQATLAADPALLAAHRDAGRMLGYDVDSWEARQRASLPGQGSVRAA